MLYPDLSLLLVVIQYIPQGCYWINTCHKVVNHSFGFVNAQGAHTKQIENPGSHLKHAGVTVRNAASGEEDLYRTRYNRACSWRSVGFKVRNGVTRVMFIYIFLGWSWGSIFSRSFCLIDSLVISWCIHWVRGKFLFIGLFIYITKFINKQTKIKEETCGNKVLPQEVKIFLPLPLLNTTKQKKIHFFICKIKYAFYATTVQLGYGLKITTLIS